MNELNREMQDKAIANAKALKAANDAGKAKKRYRFRPTAAAYALILLALIIICAAFCVRIDKVCREVEAVRAEQEAQGAHLDAIDCWLVDIEQRTEEIEAQPKLESLGEFGLSAYCACSACCPGYADGITATGTKATEGRTIAVDPRVIPYGSKVIINGHEYIAEDCGGVIKGNRIDIFFDSHSAALDFGRQTAEVYIVRDALVAEAE